MASGKYSNAPWRSGPKVIVPPPRSALAASCSATPICTGAASSGDVAAKPEKAVLKHSLKSTTECCGKWHYRALLLSQKVMNGNYNDARHLAMLFDARTKK